MLVQTLNKCVCFECEGNWNIGRISLDPINYSFPQSLTKLLPGSFH